MSKHKFEEVFNKMKQDGHNTVDHIVHWLKESKIIEESKEAKENAIKLFANVKDKEKVEVQHLKEVVNTLATQQKKNAEELHTMMAKAVPKFQEAVKKAAKAVEGAVSSKK